MTTPFSFIGRLSASKSILNRLLIAQSYASDLEISAQSACDDVQLMRAALASLSQKKVMQAGSAGTVLRFMALRASREPGRHSIEGSERLFQRPQDELIKILRQLGVRAELTKSALVMESEGWKLQGDTLLVPADRSSQFASSILLNSWNLPFDLYVALGPQKVSEGYWRMTIRLMQSLGLRIDFWDNDFRVPKQQAIRVNRMNCEIDLSSAFVIAALAAVNGRASLLDFPSDSLQPDAAFVDILRSMGASLAHEGSVLKIEKARHLGGVRVNLKNSPDLFPILAVLCGLAEGESELYGAPHLAYKESNRLVRMAEILRAMGRKVHLEEGALHISGPIQHSKKEIVVDTDQDHRIAFAGAVLKAGGYPVKIVEPNVVEKSFPDFWRIIGWHP